MVELPNIVQQYHALTFPDLKEGANLLLGTLVSTGIGLVTGWHFGRKGSKELRKEAEGLKEESAKLRRHTSLLAQGMQQAGFASFTFDANGEPTGLLINVPGAKLEAKAPDPTIISK